MVELSDENTVSISCEQILMLCTANMCDSSAQFGKLPCSHIKTSTAQACEMDTLVQYWFTCVNKAVLISSCALLHAALLFAVFVSSPWHAGALYLIRGKLRSNNVCSPVLI